MLCAWCRLTLQIGFSFGIRISVVVFRKTSHMADRSSINHITFELFTYMSETVSLFLPKSVLGQCGTSHQCEVSSYVSDKPVRDTWPVNARRLHMLSEWRVTNWCGNTQYLNRSAASACLTCVRVLALARSWGISQSQHLKSVKQSKSVQSACNQIDTGCAPVSLFFTRHHNDCL